MTIEIQLATPGDIDILMPRVRALNDHEHITVPTAQLHTSLTHLLVHPELGLAFHITRVATPIGYALTTFSYDLEFGGREAWLTEFWVDEAHRSSGIGRVAIDLLAAALRERNVGAMHLQVRTENPAFRLYERMGFVASPRTVMTKRL
ncbi:MAG TPA: GNAT family N-acetyltransferase [Kofleriaceae bacterium]|jgi:ribosomal protein S18 acetylase RimI-like enzyme